MRMNTVRYKRFFAGLSMGLVLLNSACGAGPGLSETLSEFDLDEFTISNSYEDYAYCTVRVGETLDEFRGGESRLAAKMDQVEASYKTKVVGQASCGEKTSGQGGMATQRYDFWELGSPKAAKNFVDWDGYCDQESVLGAYTRGSVFVAVAKDAPMGPGDEELRKHGFEDQCK